VCVQLDDGMEARRCEDVLEHAARAKGGEEVDGRAAVFELREVVEEGAARK